MIKTHVILLREDQWTGDWELGRKEDFAKNVEMIWLIVQVILVMLTWKCLFIMLDSLNMPSIFSNQFAKIVAEFSSPMMIKSNFTDK